MTPENFAYWLQGYFELSNTVTLNEEQVKMVREHLQLVFNKVTTDTNIDIKPIVFQTLTDKIPESMHIILKNHSLSPLEKSSLESIPKVISMGSTNQSC